MNKDARIFVAGHQGMVGSALVRCLAENKYSNVVVAERGELDLTDERAVKSFFASQQPEYVVLAAAKVGGIQANRTRPVDFLENNLRIQNAVIPAAYHAGVEKLLFLGSSCIYPREAPQPLREEYLLSGPLEETNEWYAVAKIAGIKLCQAYRRQFGFNAISAMPTNLYGPFDNFDLETSHVVPALLRKFHEASVEGADRVVVWGSGRPRREFLHVDDLAAALVFLLEKYDAEEIINIGTGVDVEIAELAGMIGEIAGFQGEVEFDSSMPDGTPRKLLSVERVMALGWQPTFSLREGLEQTYQWYRRRLS